MSVNTYFKALLGRYRDARLQNWEQPSAPHNKDVSDAVCSSFSKRV